MNQDNMKYYFVSDVKFLKLDLPVPYEQILNEARQIKERFTPHRAADNTHAGWKSLSLYGLDENKHESWQDYGYNSAIEAAKDFKWTDAAQLCPPMAASLAA